MSDAVFGPGWPGRLGDDVWLLAKDLPEDMAMRLCKVALLPPNDQCWGVTVEDRNELFARVGVVDGFRLQKAPEVRFHMREYDYKLPIHGAHRHSADSLGRLVRGRAQRGQALLHQSVRVLPVRHPTTTRNPLSDDVESIGEKCSVSPCTRLAWVLASRLEVRHNQET